MHVYLSASIADTFIFFLLSVKRYPKRLELQKRYKQMKVSVPTVVLNQINESNHPYWRFRQLC